MTSAKIRFFSFNDGCIEDRLRHGGDIGVGAVEDELCPFIVWFPFL
jgi:hypothetical protein